MTGSSLYIHTVVVVVNTVTNPKTEVTYSGFSGTIGLDTSDTGTNTVVISRGI